jgi:predicted regulator of Ras-like GTPase activity (Roadblock/LC7/MglB family)
MGTIVDHLRMLRDVQGVYGSFVVAGSGSLVDRDLPAAFDEALFADVGPRVARLFETFVSGGKDMDTCMLRYSDHKLYVRKMTWGLIGVLSSSGVNLPALRMVVNLVIRRIDPEISAIASTPMRLPMSTPPPLPVVRKAPTPPPPRVEEPDPPVPSGDRPVRMYRGRPVSD